MPKEISSLDEIRAQAEMQLIDIPGFRMGSTITVGVQPVDLSPYLLTMGIGNPLLEIVKKKAQEGKSGEEIEAEVDAEVARQTSEPGGKGFESYLPIIDAVCKEALIKPTFDEISAIRPLTLTQKIAVFNAATGDVKILRSFRRK